jgi:hypothetical protein
MRALLGVAFLIATGCDSKAKSSDPAGGGKPEQKSKEYESCGATMHCQDDLRCFDNTCRRVNRSAIGDYNAALGNALRAKGDLEGAIAAYARAVGRYDADKLGVPPDIDCAYGETLAAARANLKHAEAAAKVLHRCVLTVPASSSLRFAAMAQLVTLAESGLDPQLLGGTKTADLYLTKGPAAPSTDKLTVTVTGTPAPTAKAWPQIQDKLAVELKAAMIACWEKHNKKDELTGSFTLKVGFATNPDYPEEGSWYTKVEPAGTGEGDACVRGAAEPALKALKVAEAFNSKLSITIK